MPNSSRKTLFFPFICLLLASPSLPALAAPPVWLRGDRVELAILPAGGTLIDFHLRQRPLNPINWEVPGSEPERSQLAAAPRGHFLCLDRWGPPSPAEARRGIPFHGEAAAGDWEMSPPQPAPPGQLRLTQKRTLPLARLEVERHVTLESSGHVVRVAERVTNTGPLGRIYNMVQHPTIAPPFLDAETRIDTNASRGFCQDVPAEQRRFFDWPTADLGRATVDLRQLEVAPGEQAVSDVCSFVFPEGATWGWVTASHPGQRVLLGYVWRVSDYNWLNIWRFRQGEQRLARGLEFGTTGLHQPQSELLRQPELLGQPTFRHLDADETERRVYWMFLAELPADFAGVAAVQVTETGLELQERRSDSPRRVTLTTQLLKPDP
ncbi:MAG: hypothetical protein ACKOJF_00625 [Planctomycetaceae bacterium]